MARKSATTRSKSHRARGTRPHSSTASRRRTRSKTTTDHNEIRRWAESLGGNPACVQGTGGPEDVGMIRIELPSAPNAKDEKLEPIDWDEFFEKFDERRLALLYQDHTAGGQKSYFYKLVNRNSGRGESSRGTSTRRRAAARR